MDTSLNNVILAVVVMNDKVKKVSGGAPIFIAENEKELEKISMLISRVTMSMVHEISDGIRIIVKH
ncbi:hypothetical protein BBF96_04735 [Anoxybacter fermentans]|uniref:Uncharacterized protein n=1 Tax=Anoxybacter fermentans TaxID=1323375 RepID=A0A3S9SWW0_9FIRM|nr:hypothetical protein [Anoxybacter fermentans]AZR72758.1 hypothetical protein BBF96_04735 [Anoxybacter fermentans]